MDDVQRLLASEPASWVFDHNITWEDDIWKDDPFDVVEVHEEARKNFLDLLMTVTSGSVPVQSRIMMLQGQSGGGKTHLIRALRRATHQAGKGYFGYAQMTPDVENYAEYFLRRLVNSLEKPYNPVAPAENGLARLSQILVSEAEWITQAELEKLREDALEPDALTDLIVDMADGVVASEKFCDEDLDINIVRALLYLQRNDPRLDQRVRQYLYGRPLTELSSKSIAALDPNEGEGRAFEIIEALGRIMGIASGAALVFCIDQVEDLRFYDDPEERFQKAVRDLIQIANLVPSSIILISCLDDFYYQMRDLLPQSYIDRIEKRGPVYLKESRTVEEAQRIVERRLRYVIERVDNLPRAQINAMTLFGGTFFHEVAGLSTRRLLEAVEIRRREMCGLKEKEEVRRAPVSDQEGPVNLVQQSWERFVLDYQAEIPSEEEELVQILSAAMILSQDEGDDICGVQIQPVAWMDELVSADMSVEYSNDNRYETRLFICNKKSQGGALRRQIELVSSAGRGRNAVIIRASDFPPNPRSLTAQMLRQYLINGGRKLVIPIYEWERMITFQAFRDVHKMDPGFRDWVVAAQVLRDLPSIRQLLRLELSSGTDVHTKSQPLQIAVNGDHPGAHHGAHHSAHDHNYENTARANPDSNVHYLTPRDSAGDQGHDFNGDMNAATDMPQGVPHGDVGPDGSDRLDDTAGVPGTVSGTVPGAGPGTVSGTTADIAPEHGLPDQGSAPDQHIDQFSDNQSSATHNPHDAVMRSNENDPGDEASSSQQAHGLSSGDMSMLDQASGDFTLSASAENEGADQGEAAAQMGGVEPAVSADEEQSRSYVFNLERRPAPYPMVEWDSPGPGPGFQPVMPERVQLEDIRLGRVLGTANDSVMMEVPTLKRHAAVLGGSGSGKTTLALSVIEQLLARKIPVVLIDRKGDLCSYANPDVWAGRYGDSPDVQGLRNELKDEIDVAVYTPGRVSGRPISITLLPNGIADLPPHEQQQLANVSAAALGDMLHLGNSATHQRQGGILTVGLRILGAQSVREVTLADLISLLEQDDTELVDETHRMDPSGKLRRDLIAQLDSLRHRNWALFEGGGEPLLMDSLLGRGKFSQKDKTRLSIIYTGFLGDNENILFWVAQFLSEALRFCQRNPNEDLQAVIMFDEADLYIPANSKPATKEPLESLLKRARSAGIGLMLATQSPGDLDYKSRDQITSWFIGKVREDTALKKLKAAFSSETGIDPASVLPNQKVGEFHLIQEGILKAIKGDMSLIQAEQVPFDRIERLATETLGNQPKKQLLFDF